MPPSSSLPATAIQPDTNITVGPRKRRPTQRATENADPLARKRAKRMPEVTAEEVREPVLPPPTQRVLGAADSSDGDDSSSVEELEVMAIENDDDNSSDLEGDGTELSKPRALSM
ncbi:hypothetical protein EDB84DRAFT_1442058 [Lactarius hengduanensis]|nr:hypothetical protein EDB84DRAFT_1442058 [Lactarius hengduanensis]